MLLLTRLFSLAPTWELSSAQLCTSVILLRAAAAAAHLLGGKDSSAGYFWFTFNWPFVKHLETDLVCFCVIFHFCWLSSGNPRTSRPRQRLPPGSPEFPRPSAYASARPTGWGDWFPSPAWRPSGCGPHFSSFPPSQSVRSPGRCFPAAKETGGLSWHWHGHKIERKDKKNPLEDFLWRKLHI